MKNNFLRYKKLLKANEYSRRTFVFFRTVEYLYQILLRFEDKLFLNQLIFCDLIKLMSFQPHSESILKLSFPSVKSDSDLHVHLKFNKLKILNLLTQSKLPLVIKELV